MKASAGSMVIMTIAGAPPCRDGNRPGARGEIKARPRGVPPRRAVAFAVLASTVVLAGCTSRAEGQTKVATTSKPPVSSTVAAQPQAAFSRIPDVVRRVQPSVVTVFAGRGLGSGVVYGADGIIVTNEHVVRGAAGGRVEVAFADGRRSPGTVQATDRVTDLAVVRTERKDLPTAQFRADIPAVGELAVAIGSPLGFSNSATAGIISGLHREIPGSAQQTQSLVDLIQTDAAISPGNSGGALVDQQGRVVGINEAYIPPQAGAVSLGFAIPSATVVDVVNQLLRSGRAQHAFLGIQPAPLTAEIAEQLGVRRSTGVVVNAVIPGTPAARAGLRPGDVIVRVGSNDVPTVEEFLAALREKSPGDLVRLEVLRDGRIRQFEVVVADRP